MFLIWQAANMWSGVYRYVGMQLICIGNKGKNKRKINNTDTITPTGKLQKNSNSQNTDVNCQENCRGLCGKCQKYCKHNILLINRKHPSSCALCSHKFFQLNHCKSTHGTWQGHCKYILGTWQGQATSHLLLNKVGQMPPLAKPRGGGIFNPRRGIVNF